MGQNRFEMSNKQAIVAWGVLMIAMCIAVLLIMRLPEAVALTESETGNVVDEPNLIKFEFPSPHPYTLPENVVIDWHDKRVEMSFEGNKLTVYAEKSEFVDVAFRAFTEIYLDYSTDPNIPIQIVFKGDSQ